MKLEDKYTANVYHKRPVVVTKGRGAEVWDINGRRYIDCVAGYGTALLGHCHPKIVEAIKKQAERIISPSAVVYNDVRAELAEKLAELTGNRLNKSFFSNSGTEAVECAIKLARVHTGRKKLVAAVRGFHGRTLGSLSLTWRPEYRRPFEPLLPGVKHVPFGDEEALKNAVDNETAAIVLEPVQGEAGVILPPDGYLKAARDIADDCGALLVFDEVQTGFGRTGKVFAYEHWGVIPDILCLAKGVAGGVPIGVTTAIDEIMRSFKPGMHGTTYGGNALSAAAALAAINVLLEEDLPRRAAELGAYFKRKLDEIAKKHREVSREARGIGLMLALQLRFGDVQKVVLKALEMGVLLLSSGRTVIRMLPPLVIGKEQIDTVVDVLDIILGELREKEE